MKELFERYHVKLYNFFLKLTFDRTASEDLAQNVFYRLIKYKHSYDIAEGSFKSWMYKIARNVHFDFSKEQKKNTEQFKALEEVHENIEASEQFTSEEDLKKLNLALLQLQPDQRELIVLSRFEGLKYGEISRINGKSVVAIKVQVHRAIKQLRNFYFNQQ
ncbi:MAG TPA: RNA polymerase sigma factor [Puia sp.]|nr:RNA polymerase sigma factor [Puia sp.]